jgi:CBS domain-containing protein
MKAPFVTLVNPSYALYAASGFGAFLVTSLHLHPSRNADLELEKEEAMGTKIAEVMTERPRAITRQTSIREAAHLMGEEDVGSLPIVDEATRLVGIITDRDIAIRGVGRGVDTDKTSVAEIASQEVYAVTPDDDLDDALQTMAQAQVRRVPVVVRENELVGIVSQADVARVGKDKTTGDVVEAISRSPGGPRVTGGEAPVGGGTVRTDSPSENDERMRDPRMDEPRR